MVYANYGRVEDFDELEKTYNVNVSGKIVIARYGKIFRGNKVSTQLFRWVDVKVHIQALI